jgi:hypothetical protein
VVDDAVASDGVAIGDLFWLYRRGPTIVRTALDTAHSAVALDDMLLAITAAASTSTTAGRVYPWTGLTSTVTQTTDGTQSRRTINRIGRAMSATTSGNTNSDLLVDLMLD